MDLSVIIVNYNVRHFLDQCLSSVYRALKDTTGEVIVVDNNSADGSCSLVTEKYPGVKLIRNETNRGFSTANNQGIKISEGRYILLLNPDTIVPEGAFKRCISFMDENPLAGAAGLRMLDGRGKYLPESKRGLPTPRVSFFRISGLYRLFPRSAEINRYYLGNLDPSLENQVDVLTGAFMFLRREALEKAGLLDESFFMYGEDIDLSYRITLAGFSLYYLPDPAIIHFKGESTKKSEINYVIHFYRAMIIFARKHFKNSNSSLYLTLIQLAVLIRGAITIAGRWLKKVIFPLSEAALIFVVVSGFSRLWGSYRFGDPYYYPDIFTSLVIPAYSIAWTTGLVIWGGYRRRMSIPVILKGVLTGSLLILVIYALLPAELRFSRAVVLSGSAFILVLSLSIRILLAYTGLVYLKGLPRRVKR
ncbi:MAG: glycosyltransferase [Bacteroidales bacterium]